MGRNDDVWTLLMLFYNSSTVNMKNLSDAEKRAIENFETTGNTSRHFNFTKRKATVSLTRSGKSYLAAFLSGASYMRT